MKYKFFALPSAALLLPFLVSPVYAAPYFSMAFLYEGNSSTYQQQVAVTNGSVSEVSPDFLQVNADGSASLTNKYSSSFVTQMHAEGIKVVPYLTNNWTTSVGDQALANRVAVAKQVAALINQSNFDGVNFDLEGLGTSETSKMTDFVKDLRADLPMNKELSVSVEANPIGWSADDYASISQYADYLMVMAYDEGYPGGPESPVASLAFTEKALQYAVSVVPKEKIVLGVPFYGRVWNRNGSVRGVGVTEPQIEYLISKYKGRITYDTNQQEPKATFTIPYGSTETVDGGTLTAGTYDLWYEDQQSIEAKLSLVSKYNLKGVGSWALGVESPDVWSYFNSALSGSPIEDSGTTPGTATSGYLVKQYQTNLRVYQDFSDAIQYASLWDHSQVIRLNDNQSIWNNYSPYEVYQYSKFLKGFSTESDAIKYAALWDHSTVRSGSTGSALWDNYGYFVEQYQRILRWVPSQNEAISYAMLWDHSQVIHLLDHQSVWSNYPQYQVYQYSTLLKDFPTETQAISYAKLWDHASVHQISNGSVIWSNY